MKEYRHGSRFFWLIVVVICVVTSIAGFIMMLSSPPDDKVLLSISLCVFGASAGGFFSAFFVGTFFHYIVTDDEKIILSVTRVPKFKIKRNVIYYSDIDHIEKKQERGSHILPWRDGEPWYRYSIFLKNKTSFQEPLFKDFGESKEREIIDFLSKKVKIRKLPF